MELILDTADLDEIKKLGAMLSVDGVTTNPTIIAQSGKTFDEVRDSLFALLEPEQKVFFQVISTDYEGIMEEARYIASLREDNIFAKIPATHDGLRAVKDCVAEGVHVLCTAISSASQGFMAAKNGADYLAIYINRMSNQGDGVEETVLLQTMLDAVGLPTKVMGASLKNAWQINQLIAHGIDAVTLPVPLVYSMIDQPGTIAARDVFNDNWEHAFGKRTLR